MAKDSASPQLFQASRGGITKNITRTALMALGFLSATILTGCGSSSSAPPPTGTITTPPPLAIATASLPDGVVGTPYSQAIQATGGVAPFTWFVSVGTLPHNLKLDNSNTSKLTISGTPDMQQAAVRFTLEVTDSANQSATTSYTLNISGP